MAIAFVAATNSASASFSHTNNGNALVLYVENGANDVTATYNSVSLTKQVAQILTGAGDYITCLTLTNPATGSNTVSISGTTIGNATILSYSGVLGFANPTSGQNSGASITLAVTVSNANSWVSSCAFGRTGPHNLTPSTGVTNDRTSGSTIIGVGDSGPESAGTVNHVWNNSGSSNNTAIGLEITVAPETGGGAFLFNMI